MSTLSLVIFGPPLVAISLIFWPLMLVLAYSIAGEIMWRVWRK